MNFFKNLGKIFGFAAIGMFGWLVIASVVFVASEEDTAVAKQNTSISETEKNRDGKFEFITKSFNCGINSVKREWGSLEKPLGEFCKLEFSVTNIGNEAWYFESSEQRLVDSMGRTFEYNSSISDDNVWMENVNPGLTLTGFLYFDVPIGSNIKYFEFHDSMFSDGVRIPVK